MSAAPICPCEGFIHPRIIDNPPGGDSLSYRVGDFTTFRHALLLPLLDNAGKPVETELCFWHPAPNGDLSLQLVEWWAYIADILTFYNERIANEAYLRTAIQPESVRRLIQLLGYRPRPGIGASGFVAALLAPGAKSAALPQGMGLQNKPSPGKQPQIFELDQALTVGLPDAVSADISPQAVPGTVFIPFMWKASAVLKASATHRASIIRKASAGVKTSFSPKTSASSTTQIDSLLLKGEISGLKPGDSLLLLDKAWDGVNANYGWVVLGGTSVEKDPRGKANTRIHFASGFAPWPGFDVQNTRLLTPAQSAHLWSIPDTAGVVAGNKVHLDKLTKQLGIGDKLLFEQDSRATLFKVSSYEEVLWYANPPSGKPPTEPPDPTKVPPVAVLHSLIGLNQTPLSTWSASPANVNIHYSWREVGQFTTAPVTLIDSKDASGKLSSLTAVQADGTQASGTAFPPGLKNAKVFIEDVDGQGITANASTDATGSTLTLSDLPEQPYILKPPLRVLFNLLPVSRGKSVNGEVLGSGNASLPGQEFVLGNAPLTYFLSADSKSGDNYKSTLRVWVDDIEWMEAPSFFGRSPTERIFVTREDELGKTHVLFGDGVNGARLSSGTNNIIARYRFGSGAEAPPATSLTVILQPQPGLKAIRNPVAMGGGADPDPPSKIRKYAPRPVLTFGRAV
ncbi:MAG: hypothetical protein PHE55_22140, partial [Methylococcaceae bacterium]|nr:hypothetical protein [Methylococcaceae bacterium]